VNDWFWLTGVTFPDGAGRAAPLHTGSVILIGQAAFDWHQREESFKRL
jgi:hypothetical protein